MVFLQKEVHAMWQEEAKMLQILCCYFYPNVIMNMSQLGAVSTEGGMVQGKSYSVGLSRWVDVFLGIPFAAPPGRLAKPVAHPGWDGAYL